MKITVFQSDKGDCLLLEGGNGGLVLADGGMPETYTAHVSPFLNKLYKQKKKLDAVYVSHIDEDHIAGILQMMDDAIDWRIHDYQTTVAKNKNARKPSSLRPCELDRIWHNAFHEQVEDNTGEIEDMLAATVSILAGDKDYLRMAAFHQNVATSIRQAMSLSRRLGEGQLNIQLNPEANGKLMMLRTSASVEPITIGSMDWTIIGPALADLNDLRTKWNEWVRKNRKTIENLEGSSRKAEKLLGNSVHPEIGAIIGNSTGQAQSLAFDLLDQLTTAEQKKKVLGVRRNVTVPNLASLMFLVEEPDGNGSTKTVLMTGDGHWEDILKGLEATRKINKGQPMHVDVLKVQHHGSEHNLDSEFCKRVTADHYIFCGNGGHENPDVDVVKAILDSRLDPKHQGSHAEVGRKFKLWFNSSSKNKETLEDNRAHMKKVEDLVINTATANKAKLSYFFLEKSFFAISV